MTKTLFLALSSLTLTLFITGCGQSVPSVNTNTEEECLAINKNLLKVEKFTSTVENTSAFHLEEAAVAMQVPKISVSNNKRQMLRDAAKRKAQLEVEHQKYGCEDIIK
jgi:hypothetical protein